jgi:hypothetical protein
MGECRYSLHDLSRVDLSGGVPRFNMPFELGLAIGLRRRGGHTWWVLESRPFRLQRSLSDLNGTDPLVHRNRPLGLLQALESVFARPEDPEIPLLAIYNMISARVPDMRRRYGSVYSAGAFRTLVFAATTLAEDLRDVAQRTLRPH